MTNRSGPLLDDPAFSGDAPMLAEGESIRMLHDLMLVKRYPGDTMKSGLFIPEVHREPSCHGTVIAAGLGVRRCNDWSARSYDAEREPMLIKEGDVVMYDGSTGINAREYRKGSGIIIVAQRDVLFIAREEALVQHRRAPYWPLERDGDDHRLIEEPFNPDDYEPGGKFFEKGCDDAGYFPVGKHLPKYLRESIEAAEKDGHSFQHVRTGRNY
jgi:co-chaperonin GroES (HSP10)